MRKMETVEFGLSAAELDALANGKQLQAPLSDEKRALIYLVQPAEQAESEGDGTAGDVTPDSPDEISEGVEVDE